METIEKIISKIVQNPKQKIGNLPMSFQVPSFPYIYSFTPNIVIMEKLLTKSVRLNKFKQYINKYVKINYLEEISYRTLNTEVANLPEEFRDFKNLLVYLKITVIN